MSDTPVVSVVMNCRNGAAYLREALDSVYAQTVPDFEIVFWDNCSSDDSASIAQSRDGRLRYFRSDSALKLGAARNRAVAAAVAPFIAFLDVDDIWEREYLEAQLAAIESSQNNGLSYTDALYVLRDRAHPLCRMSDKWSPVEGDVFHDIVEGVFIGPSWAILRRSALDRVGGFDDQYDFVEESDLFLKISRHYRFAYVPRALAVYRYHDENASNQFEAQQEESARFQENLLARYPDILDRHPKMARVWHLRRRAGLMRYYWRQRRVVDATRALADVIVDAATMPGFALRRATLSIERWTGRRPWADWQR